MSFSMTRLAGFLGALGVGACGGPAALRAVSGRTLYPEYPSPDDPLAVSPCSVQKEPDIFVRNASFKLLRALGENLDFLREANPIFLCGLERIELLGDEEYRTSADPRFTRRSVGLYTPTDRVIRLKASAGITLTHEMGHHIHNLGYFAETVRAFLALSWKMDPVTGERSPRCQGSDCFVNDAAEEQPREDWARTFELILMRPIETGVAVNFSLSGEEETPAQKKAELIRSLISHPEPVRGIVRFGKAETKEEADLPQPGDPHALPSSLSQDAIRRIFRVGKATIRPYVWEKRRHAFLAGDFIVFPVYQEDRMTLGFFVYDLRRDRFSPVVLKSENLPKEFQEARGTFTSLEIVPQQKGDLLLVGRRSGKLSIAAPIEIKF